MANSNLAYDLSVYEPKPVKKQDTVAAPAEAQKPAIQVKTNPKVEPLKINMFKMFLNAMVICALIGAVLYGNVETNRLFNEISSLQSDLAALQSENIALAAEYESATSLKNVEDYAENVLGLQKLDKAQIEYVELESDTVIEIIEIENKNVFVIIKNWFADVCEYLGL